MCRACFTTFSADGSRCPECSHPPARQLPLGEAASRELCRACLTTFPPGERCPTCSAYEEAFGPPPKRADANAETFLAAVNAIAKPSFWQRRWKLTMEKFGEATRERDAAREQLAAAAKQLASLQAAARQAYDALCDGTELWELGRAERGGEDAEAAVDLACEVQRRMVRARLAVQAALGGKVGK